jgi:hypothetical protein
MATSSSSSEPTKSRAKARKVHPAVSAAGLGGALATIFWTVAAATWWKNTFSDTALAALTGATATVLAFVWGYLTNLYHPHQ